MIAQKNTNILELSDTEIATYSGGFSIEAAGLILAIAVFCYELGKDCKEHDSK